MLRGFVRMQAEASGIELNGELPLQRQRMHVPAQRLPRGAHTRQPSGTTSPSASHCALMQPPAG
jgi:hypothetical protein